MMATVNDLLNQATGSQLLPGANADAAYTSQSNPAQSLANGPLSDSDFSKLMDSIVPQKPTLPTPAATKMAALDAAMSGKRDAVSSASAAKKTAMGAEALVTPPATSALTPDQYFQNALGAETGQGAATTNELENDLRNLSQFGMIAKYGSEGKDFIGGQAGGQNQLSQTQNPGSRSAAQVWDDFNVNVGTGLGSMLGGVGALAAGIASEDAGTYVAQKTAEFNDFMQSELSPTLQARERLVEAKNALDNRDNAAQMAKDIQSGDTEIVAGLKRIGRDVIDSVDNATDDSATFVSGVANALGSFVGVGPLARGAAAISGGRLGVTTAIAATEGGGAYQQIAADIMDRDHATLMAESPMYRELISNGASPQEAKTTVANRTGLLSAGLTAPVAAATGRLVSRFEGDLSAIGSGSLTQTLANIGRETLEEAIQGGTSQFFQNTAESQLANTNKELTEGVGRQIGEGALYGMGMSAVLGAPGLARASTGKLVNSIAERAAGVTEANNQASPVSDQRVEVAAAQAQASAPVAEAVLREAVAAAPAESQAEGNAYVDQLMAANTYDAATEAPTVFQEAMGDVTNRVGAIQRMAEIVNSSEEGSSEQLRAGFYLNTLVQDYTSLLNSDPAALSALPGDSQAAQIVAQYQGLMGAIQNTPKVMTAIDTVLTAIEKSEARKAETVDAQTLATPEGQQAVSDALGIAELAPEKGNLGTNEQILYQIQQGNLQVTPRQKAALDTSVALLRAVQAADQLAQANGEIDPVTLNVRSVDGEKGKSLVQHAKGIMGAWKSGDTDLARDRLIDLHNFAQGMSNKVGALNAHLAAGNPNAQGLNYEVFVGGKPVTSGSKVAVRTGNENSVKFAQKVAGEAQLLADVYNGLVTAFPDLNGEHLSVTPLDAKLVGPAAEVVARLKPVVAAAPEVVAEDTTPDVAPAPEQNVTPVETPTQPVVQPEPVAEQASVNKQVPVETVAEPAVEETTVSIDQPEGMAAAYPSLLNTVPNFFHTAFKLPTQQRTRTIGSETPIADIRSALRDSASFTAFLGSSLNGEYTPEIARAYRDFLSTAEDFVGELDDNLQSFLGKKNMLARVLGGEEANRFVDGKALNITEESDGTLVYNPELIQTAVLAGIQWFLNSDQYGTIMDAKDIAEAFGMTEATISDRVVEALNQGMSVTEAKRSLASKVRNYWGLQNSPDGAIGYQEGIPEAIAAELLSVMMKGGWLSVETTTLTEKDGLPAGQVRTIDRLIPNREGSSPLNPESPINAFPEAIEQAVMIEPEMANYIGEDTKPPVATDQLRNPGVKNTAQQLEAIKNEQATPYYVNTHMAGFYSAMGRDAVLRMFGAGNTEGRAMNENHRQSMDGVNRSTVAAFDHLQNVVAQVANTGDLATTPIRYGFNMTRVARLQMLGKYNPQSNKLIREAILPTQSTLDLSSETGTGYKQFTLGLAQMLGVKVHKMFPFRSRAKVEAMLTGPLAPSVEALRNWTKGFDASQVLNAPSLSSGVVDTLIDNFKSAGEPLTPMGLHAVMEYARYLETGDKSAFKTAAYVEADGVTNGPINAMVLFTTGMFKADWVRNIAKGGLFFNRGAETVNSNVEGGDSTDLYQATTDKLKAAVASLRSQYAGNERVTDQFNALFSMMDEFLGGDLQFDGETLTLQRGIAKNPLTITIYGSGAGGIAAKITKAIIDSVYERMSQVAEAQANDENISLAEAMFGPQSVSLEDAQARLQRFAAAYTALTTSRVKNVKGELAVVGAKSTPPKRLDPVKFTFDKDSIENMQANMRLMFVDPMRDAIQATVGSELMGTAEILRQATQVQSIVLEHAFKAEVEAALTEKAKDPSWKKGDFLTVKELDAVRAKLEHLAPLVRTGTQDFFIAGSQTTDLSLTDFARSLDGKLRTDAFVNGPRDAGVSGIPFMNIGAGDGQMMQNISVAKGAPTGTLKIFDGMNMPLDQVEAGSEVANKAVFDSWMGNPLAAVHKSFADFMSDAKLTGMPKKQRLALSKALFGLGSEIMPESDVIQAMQDLVGQLNEAQMQIEARHRVMNRVQISVDQMAAGMSPFTKQGDLPLVGQDADAIADQLTAYYNVELNRIRGEQTNRQVHEEFYDLGTPHDSGVTVLSGADLSQVGQALPANQRAVLNEVISSLTAQDYNIVLGDAQQIADYNASLSLPSASSTPSGAISGYTNIGSKTIYIIDPTTETLTHELIHAATFEATLAHYEGKAPKIVSDAVGRLESMMEQFRTKASELTQTNEQVNNTYSSALSAINTHLIAGNKAAALNEFMAWTLASESLSRIAERTQVSKFGKLRDAVVGYIKSLLGIKATAGKDLFSNLLFNSSILMHEQPKLSEKFNSSTLFQNSQFGDNDRLTSINEALDKTIGRYLNEAPVAGRFDPASAMHKAIQNGFRVAQSFMAHGFNMNMQEASTFKTIVTALSTEAAIDPNSMAAVQSLYTHVMKNLSVELFMADSNSTDPADRYYASKKFDVLSGKFLVTQDVKGRSSLLPAFLALATTNTEFRSVLEKMDLPKSAYSGAGTLDALLENYGNKAMDSLGQRMAGQSAKASNVQQAIDSLNAHMAKVINDKETFIDQMASKGQGVLDRANDLTVNGLSQLSAALLNNATRANKNAANKLDRTVAGVGAAVAAVINETAAEGVAQATIASVNKTLRTPQAVRDLIGDLVGRTLNNANVYDMIKAVKSVVQRTRQQYREDLPVRLASEFSRELTDAEWSSLHNAMGKTDLAALMSTMKAEQVLDLVTKPAELTAAIKALETDLANPHIKAHLRKAKQLAKFMVTGEAGANLLRNAESVARLNGEGLAGNPVIDVAKLDNLISMYAMQELSQGDKDTLASLVQEEGKGLAFSLSYLNGQRQEEARKATGMAKMNAYKGYIPQMLNEGVSMVVAHDSQYSRLLEQSYERVGDYEGSTLERGLKRGYYFIPVAARGAFEQGIMQNVVQTAGGVNTASGLTIGQTAGVITDAAEVKLLAKRMHREVGKEPLLPVYDEAGSLIAFERALDPAVMERVQAPGNLAKAIGQWRGRQVEEGFAQNFNEQLIDNLYDMYEKDLRESSDNARQYVDVLNTSDPVLKDAVRLMSRETKAYVESKFGGKFFVRKDMLNDAFGYRSASIGDAWTGNTRWSNATQKAVRNLAVAALGNDAYKTLMNAEKLVQNVVADAKVLIVVKSVVVPAVNMISNVFQLAARGVPLNHIVSSMPKKTAEVEAYTRSLVRRIEAEAELRASTDPRTTRKLETEIQSINDSHRRMSIWPLIEAGEFTGISDAGMTRAEINLTSGRLQAYMEQAAQKLPGWGSTLGRYALVTKDTALFQGLQKAVEYGDFLAKATLYDDLVNRKGLDSKAALARITEEFVNYDRLSGRFRGSMESMGLLWFYNFKIRSAKVAMSMIRNNPIHTLLATLTPAPTLFGTVGLPTEDNIFAKLFDGTLDRSIGPGQGIHSMMLNPWVNLTQ